MLARFGFTLVAYARLVRRRFLQGSLKALIARVTFALALTCWVSIATVLDELTSLYRGGVGNFCKADGLFLLKHALVILSDLGTVVVDDVPVDLGRAIVHRCLVHALLMLIVRLALNAHDL